MYISHMRLMVHVQRPTLKIPNEKMTGLLYTTVFNQLIIDSDLSDRRLGSRAI